MRPENRALLVIFLAFAVVVTPVGAYLLLTSSVPPSSIPVPAGTTFTSAQALNWTAHFTVGAAGGTLVGAWTAYNGSGFLILVVVNGTVSRPSGPVVCPLVVYVWQERNGTVDVPLAPGPYTMYWSAGYCSSAQSIVVTRTIQLAPA